MNREVSVVHLTTVHHPMDTRIFHKECGSLAAAGFRVTLIATEHPDLAAAKPAFEVLRLSPARNRWARMTRNCWQAYKLAKRLNADIYHFHDPELIWVGWLLKNKRNQVVYDIHEDYETGIRQKKYLPRFARRLLAGAYRLAERLCIGRFELVLAEKYYYDKYGRGTAVLNYPLLGPAIESGERPSADEGEGQPREQDQIRLLYTGNITLDRGALVHARAVKLDPRIRLYMIGKCPRPLSEQMLGEAGGHKERLHIEGIDAFISRETIDGYYRAGGWTAGLALFPPTDHYMQKELTKFFEYMNAGLPIVCSDFPSWKAFVEKHRCGIAVNPYDDKAILEALTYLHEHPDEAQQMGRNGQRAVRSELNWEHEQEKLISMYIEGKKGSSLQC